MIVRDADAEAPAGEAEARERAAGQVVRARRFLDELGVPSAARPAVEAFCWWTEDPPDTPGVPGKQTLERLLCGALAEGGADRGASVSAWLDALPAGPALTHKNVAMAWFAKYTPAESQEWFYGSLWSVPESEAAVRRRLERVGGAEVFGRLIAGT